MVTLNFFYQRIIIKNSIVLKIIKYLLIDFLYPFDTPSSSITKKKIKNKSYIKLKYILLWIYLLLVILF